MTDLTRRSVHRLIRTAFRERRASRRPYLSGDVVVIGWTRFNQVPLISPDYSALDPSARARGERPGTGSTRPGHQCMRIVLRHVVRFISFVHSFVRSAAAAAGELQLSLSCGNHACCILISDRRRKHSLTLHSPRCRGNYRSRRSTNSQTRTSETFNHHPRTPL